MVVSVARTGNKSAKISTEIPLNISLSLRHSFLTFQYYLTVGNNLFIGVAPVGLKTLD